MLFNLLLGRRTVEVPCTIEVERTHDSLHAHVELNAGFEIGPGDVVTVQGDTVHAAFGDRFTLQRRAVIVRASLFDRLWTKLVAGLELTELYEVSFSSRRKL
jgi:hypothetical protein